jgi:hypothetical protein
LLLLLLVLLPLPVLSAAASVFICLIRRWSILILAAEGNAGYLNRRAKYRQRVRNIALHWYIGRIVDERVLYTYRRQLVNVRTYQSRIFRKKALTASPKSSLTRMWSKPRSSASFISFTAF